MHTLQKQILKLARQEQLNGKNLREIGDVIGERHLQKVKHHLSALVNNNLLRMNKNGDYQLVEIQDTKLNQFINIPVYGNANCGVATLYATDRIEGRIKISKSALKRNNYRDLIVLKAVGESMNRSNVNGDSINHGDYLIIDTANKDPQNGDYVVSIINNMANIKKYLFDKGKNEVRLISESSKKIAPIIATESDSFLINGIVIKIIKSK